MAVTVPPEVDFLLNALVGQDWPTGDEDALRRCAQAWTDALAGVAGLAGYGNAAAQGVGAHVEAISAEQFRAYWDKYTGGDQSHLGELARQCESMAGALLGQANEVEYAKLSIVFTLILVAIQIAWAIAAAIETLGGSLAEIGLAMFIGRQSVLMIVSRFLQIVLTMLVPDLVTQAVMKARGHESGWDWGKTGPAAENAVLAGVIGGFLGAGVARLPFMGGQFGETLGGKIVQGLAHFGEGGTVNVATGIVTGAQSGQPLDAGGLWKQFVSGGVLATAFYLPHVAAPHGTPLAFTAADGNRYQVVLSDPALAHFDANGHQLPAGYSGPVFDSRGLKAGTATFSGATVSFDHPVGGSPSVDLTRQGFAVGGHDGSVTRYGYPPGPAGDGSLSPQPVSCSRPSDGTVSVDTAGGPLTVPAGSVVHYTPDGVPYRADVAHPGGDTITTWQTGTPGDPLQQTGHVAYPAGPAGAGEFLGIQKATFYGPDGTTVLASASALTGHVDVLDPAGYQQAFGDHYSTLGLAATGGHSGRGGQPPGLVAPELAGRLPGRDGAGPGAAEQVLAQRDQNALNSVTGLAAGAVLSDLIHRGADPVTGKAGGLPGDHAGAGHPGPGSPDDHIPVMTSGAGAGDAGGQVPLPDGVTQIEPPPGYEYLRGSLFRTPAGVAVYDRSDVQMLAAAGQVRGDGGSFVWDAHGAGGIPRFGGLEFTPGTFLDMITVAGWDGRQRIVLLSCDAGHDGMTSFAARVASLLPGRGLSGVEVIAPTERVWQAVGDSRVVIAGRAWSEQHRMWLPDQSRPGRWAGFTSEDGIVSSRTVAADGYGMPAAEGADNKPGTVGAAAPERFGQAGLAGNGSAHSPPVRSWLSRAGQDDPQPPGHNDAAAAPIGDILNPPAPLPIGHVHGQVASAEARQALELAATTRTGHGSVDHAVVTRLLESLPVLPADAGSDAAALSAFVTDALGRGPMALSPVGGGGAKGQSGAPVNLVLDELGHVVAVAKVFPRSEEFARELSSLHRLSVPEFTKFSVPEVLAVGVAHTRDGTPGVLVYSVAPGRPLDDLIAEVGNSAPGPERAQRLAELTAAVRQTAAALAELHVAPAGSGGPVAPTFLDLHAKAATDLTEKVVANRAVYKKYGDLNVEELRHRVDAAITMSRSERGAAALVHGDAHPGNFFWSPELGVTFIDAPTLHFSMNADGVPIGSPERDINNFDVWLAHFGNDAKLASDEIGQVRGAFLSTYRESGGAPLHEGQMAMFGARSVLNKLRQIGDAILMDLEQPETRGLNENVRLQEARLQELELQLRTEIGLLRDSLGWTS